MILKNKRLKSKKITDSVANQFTCNPKTGILRWAVNKPNSTYKINDKVFSKTSEGYLCVMVDKKLYMAHRICYYIYYNKSPENIIDHINHDITDNRKINIRECTASQNGMNRKIGKNNKSGYKGVIWHKAHNLWMAQITVNKKIYFLGYFKKLENAVNARLDAEKKHFGEFSYVPKEQKIKK